MKLANQSRDNASLPAICQPAANPLNRMAYIPGNFLTAIKEKGWNLAVT